MAHSRYFSLISKVWLYKLNGASSTETSRCENRVKEKGQWKLIVHIFYTSELSFVERRYLLFLFFNAPALDVIRKCPNWVEADSLLLFEINMENSSCLLDADRLNTMSLVTSLSGSILCMAFIAIQCRYSSK